MTHANRTDNIEHASSLDNFAAEPRWVAWREEKRKRRDGTTYKTKIPHNPNYNRHARIPTDPSTWGTRKEAERAWRKYLDDGRPGGIGIVLGELEDGTLLMGIDLDGCVDPESEKINSWAKEVLDRFDTYAEVSPSGEGIKMFFLIAAKNVDAVFRLMKEPKTGKSRLRVEFVASEHIEIALDRGRYYTVTDQWLEDWPETLRTVSVEDVRWFISEAGPSFLEQHGIGSRNAERSSRPHDESGSGHGFRFMKGAGDSYEEARKAILDDTGKAGEWARRTDERQLQRAWDNGNNSEGEKRPLIRRRINQFERRKLEWLWYPFIPQDMITLLLGDKAVGKSSVALDVAARISKGSPLPCFGNDREERAPLGSVIILCKENDVSRIIRPRLEAAGADLNRIHTLGYEVPDDPKQIDPLERLDTTVSQLEEQIREIGDVKLIIVDPITDYLGKIDMFRDNQVRNLLNPLGHLASRYNLAILNVLHVNKKQDMAARYRGLGSVAFRNVAQSTMMVVASGSPAEQFMVQDAANLCAETRAVTFSMSTVGAYHCVDWGSEWHEVDLDEVMANKQPSKKETAKTLLSEWLADGPVRVEKLKEWTKQKGISWRTMNGAKTDLFVEDYKQNGVMHGGWFWKLS